MNKQYYETLIVNSKKKIIFTDSFDEELSHELLAFLQNFEIVEFGFNFNQNIDKLPDNIEELKLDAKFNTPVTKWPSQLQTLKFEAWDYLADGFCIFNHKLQNLPTELKELMIGTFYNQNINDLPDSIEKLYFTRSTHYTQPIHKLPKNLKKINLGRITTRNMKEIICDKSILDNLTFIKDWND